MKKLTIAIVALALVCSCVFADSYSATAGLGFGGYMAAQKKIMESPLSVGPALFAGFDYNFENGLVLYDDLALNLAMIDVIVDFDTFDFAPGKVDTKVISLTEQIGAGYSFHFDKFDVMVGGGLGIRTIISGLDAAMPNVVEGIKEYNATIENKVQQVMVGYEKTKAEAEEMVKEQAGILSLSESMKFTTIDLALRVKGTYNINDQWAVSVQANPTVALKTITNINEFNSLKADDTEALQIIASQLGGKISVAGANLLIGATYKF